MKDPIQDVIERITNCSQLRSARKEGQLRPNFLNSVGEVFEIHGFETTRLYLLSKRHRRNMKRQADTVLAVLEILRDCPPVQQNRAIGRQIIKSLHVI